MNFHKLNVTSVQFKKQNTVRSQKPSSCTLPDNLPTPRTTTILHFHTIVNLPVFLKKETFYKLIYIGYILLYIALTSQHRKS